MLLRCIPTASALVAQAHLWSSGVAAVSSVSNLTSHSASSNSSDTSSSASTVSSGHAVPWDESKYLEGHEEVNMHPEQEQQVDGQQLLRQLLRKTHAAEAAMTRVLAGQQLVMHGRPDAAYFVQQEQQALESVQQLLPRYRVRPSALLSVLQTAGLAAGAVAALGPAHARDAVIAALQETLTELYNEQLRLLREAGLSEEAADVRAVLIKLRNLERATEGAQAPPDLLTLQQAVSKGSLAGIGVIGAVGAVLKVVADAAITAAGRV